MPESIKPIGQIVVAFGGKQANPGVVHETVRMASLLKAEIKVVHMRLPRAGDLTMMMDPLPVYTEEELRAQFHDAGYGNMAETVSVQICRGKNLAILLAQVTKGADMLIIGHKYRNRIQAVLSTSSLQHQILDVISCPVLVVPQVSNRQSKIKAEDCKD